MMLSDNKLNNIENAIINIIKKYKGKTYFTTIAREEVSNEFPNFHGIDKKDQIKVKMKNLNIIFKKFQQLGILRASFNSSAQDIGDWNATWYPINLEKFNQYIKQKNLNEAKNMKKTLLNEVKESMKIEKSFDEKIYELHELFEKLEKKDFNSNILREMQITASVGTRPRIYSNESLVEMLKHSKRLINSDNKTLSKIGKTVGELCENIIDGTYDNLLITEFSSDVKYYPTKKLFTAFQNNYGLSSKLF
jgi:hypothetical protein